MLRRRGNSAKFTATPSCVTLFALAGVRAKEVPKHLAKALRRPNDLTLAAWALIRDDPSWCPQVHRLFHQLSLDSRGRAKPGVGLCAEYLVKNCYRASEVIRVLGSIFGMAGHAAVFAARFQPELAVPPLRTAMAVDAGDQPMAAAILALIDEPWSRRELTDVLDRSEDPGETFLARLALRESRDERVRRVADIWESAILGLLGDASGVVDGALGSAAGPGDSGGEGTFRRWLNEFRPLLSEIESPTPFTDMVCV